MPRTSKQSAPDALTTTDLDVRVAHLAGGYSVCFESHLADADLTGLFDGLPDDVCGFPRWGYVLRGRVTFRMRGGDEETFSAGDAYYVAPGHVPVHHADCELVEFSPTEILAQTIPVVVGNLRAHGVAV